jgi:hypothetical protein
MSRCADRCAAHPGVVVLSCLETTATTAGGNPDVDPEDDSDLAAREGDQRVDVSDPGEPCVDKTRS